MDTKVGKIATMIISDESPDTPLQRKLGEIGKKLGLAALVICALMFVIGITRSISATEMFMTSIGLAVAAIPEGLPAIVTILLAIGVTKMAKKSAIIRKLPAVETLGSSSVICSDKTGTLTQNKMQVVAAQVGGEKLDARTWESEKPKENAKFLFRLASMCTDCMLSNKNNEVLVDGEATEKAIVTAALNVGENKDELYKEMKRVEEISFESKRKMMTTIHRYGNKFRVITKGAPDVLIRRCLSGYECSDEQWNLERSRIMSSNEQMASNALRVIAVAYKDIEHLPSKIDESLEQGLVFVGLIGMIDPPREGVKQAVKTCAEAGIKTVMITGDHIITAKAIAIDLGILKAGDIAITGDELDKIPQDRLEQNIHSYSVFARVSPEHKVRIVKAFRSAGNIVAMTGDGVNDAPALKSADIGVAMGIAGTDVAKNAADMILTDDNFVTITEAVKTGRHIFANMRKSIHFLISTNVGEIVAMFVGLLLGLDAPLLAIHLLWINLVTDSFPAIALGLEPAEENIMRQKPRDHRKGLFADGLWGRIFVEGLMIGTLTLLAFSIGNNLYGLAVRKNNGIYNA